MLTKAIGEGCKMQVHINLILKTLLNVILVVIFWTYFGSVSVERYQKQNVLVSSSTIASDPDGLDVPAITICRRNSITSMGWNVTENTNITTMSKVLVHMCGGEEDITKCIEEKTYGQSDIYYILLIFITSQNNWRKEVGQKQLFAHGIVSDFEKTLFAENPV